MKLAGHVLAVTSVDWILLGNQSLLASCSDDRVRRELLKIPLAKLSDCQINSVQMDIKTNLMTCTF